MEQVEIFKKEIEDIYNKEKPLSFSALKAFLQSPKHFYNYKMNKEVTEAMQQGKRFHMCILEPEKFNSKYWVLNDDEIIEKIRGAKPRATTKYKEWLLQEQEKNTGKELVKKDEVDLYMSMKEYLEKCTATKDLMSGLIHREKKINFEHEDLLINGIIDGEGKDYLIDLKKVADASFKRVRCVIEDMYYHMQAAIYTYATNKKDYYLIFIDNSINVTVVKLSKEKITEGFSIFTTALENFKNCVEEDKFYYSYEFFNNGYILY